MLIEKAARRSKPMLIVTVLLSIAYLALAVRFWLRIESSDLNASARGFFYSALLATVVLYGVTLVQAAVQRRREGSLLPVSLAAAFGVIICLLFFGP
jgi:hypothetical protein